MAVDPLDPWLTDEPAEEGALEEGAGEAGAAELSSSAGLSTSMSEG